jgi:hypothetical protein
MKRRGGYIYLRICASRKDFSRRAGARTFLSAATPAYIKTLEVFTRVCTLQLLRTRMSALRFGFGSTTLPDSLESAGDKRELRLSLNRRSVVGKK